MPTILFIYGWRLFFYSNEGNEHYHIHCQKGDKECKYWLFPDEYEIEEAYSFNMNPSDKRVVKKLIYTHFDYLIESWKNFFGEKDE